MTDEEVALQMAMDEYDEQENMWKKMSNGGDGFASSQTTPKRKVGTADSLTRLDHYGRMDRMSKNSRYGDGHGKKRTSRYYYNDDDDYYDDYSDDNYDDSHSRRHSHHHYSNIYDSGKKQRHEESNNYGNDDVLNDQEGRLQKSNSCSNNRNNNNHDGAVVDDVDISSKTTTIEERKKRRLEKLLEKTDSMVNKLSSMMEAVKKTAVSFHTHDNDHNNYGEQGQPSHLEVMNKSREGGDIDINALMDKTQQQQGNVTTDTQAHVSREEQPKSNGMNKSGAEVKVVSSTQAPPPSSSPSSSHVQVPTLKQPHFITGGTLRDYQLHGVEWLCGIHYAGLNGILADEMGLGKTVQIIAFLCALWERYSIAGPHLTVMPMSVLSVWKADIAKFAPGIAVHIHHGNKIQRHEQFKAWSKKLATVRQQFQRANNQLGSGKAPAPKKPEHISVVITTYELAIKDLNLLKKQSKGIYKW